MKIITVPLCITLVIILCHCNWSLQQESQGNKETDSLEEMDVVKVAQWHSKSMNKRPQRIYEPGSSSEHAGRFRKHARIMASSTPSLTDSNAIGDESRDLPTSVLELSISARRINGKNPSCIVSMQETKTSKWIEYGTTETIQDSPDSMNPNFATKIKIPFRFGEKQRVKFEIYNLKSSGPNWSLKYSLGFAICDVAQIVQAGSKKLQLELAKNNSAERYAMARSTRTFIIIGVSESPNSNEQVILQLNGANIGNHLSEQVENWNLFLKIYMANSDASKYTLVHETETIKATSEPKWKPLILSLENLAAGEYDRRLKFECWNWNSKENENRYIGKSETSIKELQIGVEGFFLTRPDETQEDKIYGEIGVEDFKILKNRSFLDYIWGGLQIRSIIGVDFSKSNAPKPGYQGLHDISDRFDNSYEQAISSIVSTMGTYDARKCFSVYGFPITNTLPQQYINKLREKTDHLGEVFNIDLDADDPICIGDEGILAAYRKCVQEVTLENDLDICPLLKKVSDSVSQDRENYFILWILTSGQEMSTDNLQKALEKMKVLSTLPVSVVIGRIGNGTFEEMEAFEESVESLKRDMVQVVPFNEFTTRFTDDNFVKQALAKVPGQLLMYMQQENIAPKPQPFLQPVSSVPVREQ